MPRKKLQISKECKFCKKTFLCRGPNGKLNRKKVFCNNYCSQKGRPRKRGYSLSPEHRKKIGDAQRGDKGNNWKGGKWSSQPQSERKSSAYKTLRKEVLQRDGYKCVLCSSREKLEMDHIKSYSKYPDLRYQKSNLRILCHSCHRKTDSFAKG